MYKQPVIHFIILIAFLWGLMGIFVTYAQSQSGGLLLQEIETGLEIVSIDEAGNIISIVQSLPDYSFTPSPTALWILHPSFLIPTLNKITLSPDGNQIAFVAIQNEEQFRLVIFQQDTGILIEENLDGYAYPIWSPNGDELLLEMVYVPDGFTLPESMIYTPSSHTFRPISHDFDNVESHFQWLNDDNHIIYQKNRNIFLTDRFGSFDQQLTHIEEQISSSITPSLCDMIWSAIAQRIYFTVGCVDDTEYLYSVDLAGNVRLELSTVDLYSEGYLAFFVPMTISGIFPSVSSTDIFVLLDVVTANPNDSSLDTIHAIHRLTAPETTQLIYENRYTVDDAISISAASISLDGNFLAFAGGDQTIENSHKVNVINLITGERVFEQGSLQGICDLDWLSTTVVAYEAITRLNCFAERFAENIQSFDILSGYTNTISSTNSTLAIP